MPQALPQREISWTQWLVREESRRNRSSSSHAVASSASHSAFVSGGRLLVCGQDDHAEGLLGQGEHVIEALVPLPTSGHCRCVRIAGVSAGYSHTLALSSGGAAFSFGFGGDGRLGHGDVQCQHSPRAIEALAGVTVCAVATGCAHSLALSVAGDVHTFGWGRDGQLGLGDGHSQWLPKALAALLPERVWEVAAGVSYSLALTDRGELYTFGDGSTCQLGHGDRKDRFQPTLVEALKGVKVRSVAAGEYHTCAVTDDGALYTWGNGASGKLGHGDRQTQTIPMRVAALGKAIRSVAAGREHTLAVSESGTVYSFGHGGCCQLGVDASVEEQLTPQPVPGLEGICVQEVAAGYYTSLAVTSDGAVFGWGQGSNCWDEEEPADVWQETSHLEAEYDDQRPVIEPCAVLGLGLVCDERAPRRYQLRVDVVGMV